MQGQSKSARGKVLFKLAYGNSSPHTRRFPSLEYALLASQVGLPRTGESSRAGYRNSSSYLSRASSDDVKLWFCLDLTGTKNIYPHSASDHGAGHVKCQRQQLYFSQAGCPQASGAMEFHTDINSWPHSVAKMGLDYIQASLKVKRFTIMLRTSATGCHVILFHLLASGRLQRWLLQHGPTMGSRKRCPAAVTKPRVSKAKHLQCQADLLEAMQEIIGPFEAST